MCVNAFQLKAANPLVQEQLPVEEWGTNIVSLGFDGRTNGDSYRILAAYSNTLVTITGTVVTVTNWGPPVEVTITNETVTTHLDAGQFCDIIIDGPVWFQSTQPIQVARFAHSHYFDYDTNPITDYSEADPCEIVLLPVGHYLQTNILATGPSMDFCAIPPTGFDRNYLNIIAPQTATNATYVDGLLLAATNFATSGGAGVSGNHNGFHDSASAQFGSAAYTAAANPFQTAGGGNYYLNGDDFRQKGAGIDAQLLADLKTRTTWPPVPYANISLSTIQSGTTFNPQAVRDNTGTPDLGYHYDALDYLFQDCVADTGVTFNPGTAVGWQGQGLAFSGGYAINFNGTAAFPGYFVRANTVQEADSSGDGTGMTDANGNDWPTVNATFTRFSALGNTAVFFDANSFYVTTYNCEFWNGLLGGNVTGGLQWQCFNCLFDRSLVNFSTTAESPYAYLSLQNATLHGGSLTLDNFNNNMQIYAHDSAFDGTAINAAGVYGDASYNAYLSGADALPNDHDDVTVSGGFNWQGGWSGNFYLPANSPLINSGNQAANGISVNTGYTSTSLATFTTQTSGTPEGDTTVDIGYHCPALLAWAGNQQFCPNGSFYLSWYNPNPDVYGSPLTYSIVASPAHGSLSGLPSDLIYTPDQDYAGWDTFTYQITDGLITSGPLVAAMAMGDLNPQADSLNDEITGVGQPVTLTLSGTDGCGDPLTFTVVSGPANGQLGSISLFGDHAQVVYTPDTGPAFQGVDSFDFTVNSGVGNSPPATVKIFVIPGPTLTAGCRPRGVMLTWDTAAIQAIIQQAYPSLINIDGFNVYRSTTPGGPYDCLTPAPLGKNIRRFEDASVTPDTVYYYVVTCIGTRYFQGDDVPYESPSSNEIQCSTCCEPSAAGLWTDEGPTAQELAEWIMGPNVTVQNAAYTGAAEARGIFAGGDSVGLNGHQFPIDHGVIMASGDIANAVGPNDRPDMDTLTPFGLPGDNDLDNLVGGGGTDDAVALEFDFVSTSSFQLQIQYVFASEEFLEWVGQEYVDPMAIFITTNQVGTNWVITPADNIAVIPDTTTPVNVNTMAYTQYYVDNPQAVPPDTYNLQYDGFTTLLTAQANISANVTYHVKIAIADAPNDDDVLDSAVFIKTQSFPCQ